MTLNINLFNQSELTAISTCQFDQEILAVQKRSDGSKIIKISRDQITCWQLFLRFFGLGNLASTDIHLKNVVTHLNQYNWHEEIEPDSPQYNCYLKVCDIANKALISKSIDTLYVNVAKESRDVEIEVVREAASCSVLLHMHWNPSLQVKHLLAFMRMNCPVTPELTPMSIKNGNGVFLHRDLNLSNQAFHHLTPQVSVIEDRMYFPLPASFPLQDVFGIG